jgi:fermentation-respiration switch protein FrsA (DUF1100 family)
LAAISWSTLVLKSSNVENEQETPGMQFHGNQTRMIRNILLAPVLVSTGLYILLVLGVYFFQARLLFFPNQPGRRHVQVPTDIGLQYESVRINTTDGFTLDGWFVPVDKARRVILFLHGNAGNISHRLDSIRIFNKLGLGTLIIDYRGYGSSTGTPTEAGTYLDAEAAWRYLVEERGFSPQDIIICGRSLGGAVAVHLASQQKPAALIVESTFTSVPDLAAELYPWLPARWLCRFRYDSLQKIRYVTCPVLVVHSSRDEIIPARHGRMLFSEARAVKEFLEISGSHDAGFLTSGNLYSTGLAHFLSIHQHESAPPA